MNKIAKYVMVDILKNNFILGFTFFLFLISFAIVNLEGVTTKAMLSMLNIVLLIIPLVSLVFTTVHFYNSYEFIELMVSQPIKRSWILLSEYLGLSISLTLAMLVGMGIPILLYGQSSIALYLLIAGTALIFVFTALAILCSVLSNDKAKGIGLSLLIWFFCSVIYGGLMLIILFTFSDYPVEKYMLLFTSMNPVDLVRVSILMQMDTAALMGYTGAIFKQFFNEWTGLIFALMVLSLWTAIPLFLAVRIFNRKDL
jgi:Cu-processing system permease protein